MNTICIPCAHIATFYEHKWQAHPCIAFNILRHAYRRCSEGNHRPFKINNVIGGRNNLYFSSYL